MGEFVKALLGCGAASKIPKDYDWFAPLLGDWDFDYYDLKDGRRVRHVQGEWLFRRALDGTCIEDLFICPSRDTRESNPQPDGEYGAAVRMFNPETKGYDMVYTTRGSMIRLEIQKEKEQIVCTVLDNTSAKWVFDRMTGDAFHWKNVTVVDDGHWRTNCEVYAVRKINVDYGSVYEDCPVFDNGRYHLRLAEEADGADLLKVYSDEKAVPFFNSDNCHGDIFHYTSLERMKEAIRYWLWEYERKGFVRWSIWDHAIGEAIGTIELFHRDAEDYFTNCGLLRLDLRSDYEKKECIKEILEPMISPAFSMFSCEILATKAVPEAQERVWALAELGFQKRSEILIGHDGTQYGSYWILRKRS